MDPVMRSMVILDSLAAPVVQVVRALQQLPMHVADILLHSWCASTLSTAQTRAAKTPEYKRRLVVCTPSS